MTDCPICQEINIHGDSCVCLDCGEKMHNTCWNDFVKSTRQTIRSDRAYDMDMEDVQQCALVHAACPCCRADTERILKIGRDSAVHEEIVAPVARTQTLDAPVARTRTLDEMFDNLTRRYFPAVPASLGNRGYENTPHRQCNKCVAVLRAGHRGNYCDGCHRERRRERRRVAEWREAGWGAAGTGGRVNQPRKQRKCGQCGVPGHDRRTCPVLRI